MTETARIDRAWLQSRIERLIEDETPVDQNENLVLYGLDSISVMSLAQELCALGIPVSFQELAADPTLAAWWTLISERQSATLP
ncbi:MULTISPECIES: phosphopantetheine-binding protein [unclassified Paracoccus (in: a-proteobacteria)]|uniref:phosphopantetheine-binding protein n=1 Tax=unclassified Paracoccus (in: a-proteobacteria) TaxID=2688777 RepID=UPI001E5136B7|nr:MULTISPECIES: phosphopantetheine-binding protein [unclassified Paracoccus (in: a-proteobacteria)]UXU75516.1 phosphopantetheine-binding protein [Paracoccus sp. SMMA_5]UXU81421.1 phosphopantetheine-binding protein [Paracoccus sp. SMMA_5_TC]